MSLVAYGLFINVPLAHLRYIDKFAFGQGPNFHGVLTKAMIDGYQIATDIVTPALVDVEN